jgi:hypothetical protein
LVRSSRLNDPDEIILAKKYAAPRLETLNPVDLNTACRVLLLKIHVITGWVIPANELMIILVDQFSKKLSESYGMLNVEEIEYAFRNQGTIIEDWGKEMNLNLLDKVLIPYLNQRLQVSQMEERKKDPPVQKVYTDQELDDLHRGDVEAFFQRCRSGIVPTGIPSYFKDILEKDGLLKDESVEVYFTRKLGDGSLNIYTK